VRLEPVSLLDGNGNAVVRSIPGPSVATSAGRYFVAPVLGDGAIAVFSASGELSTLFGREGGGPQEFSSAQGKKLLRVDADGHLYVFDGIHVHVINATSLQHLDKRTIRMIARDAAIVGSSTVVQWPVGAPGGMSTPLQVFSDGSRQSFGIGASREHPLTEPAQLDSYRVVARTADGLGLWSGFLGRYVVSRFTLDGSESVRVIRDSEWFQPYGSNKRGEGVLIHSRPRLVGLRETTDGLIDVAIAQGDANFQPLSGNPSGETPLDDYLDLNRFFDTTVEVIDIRRGRVIARARFDDHLNFVDTSNGDVELFSLKALADGDKAVQIFRLAVTGR